MLIFKNFLPHSRSTDCSNIRISAFGYYADLLLKEIKRGSTVPLPAIVEEMLKNFFATLMRSFG